MTSKNYFDYSDILIRPSNKTKFNSRKDVSITNFYRHVPVCAANMHGVGTIDVGIAMQSYGMLTFVCKDVPLKEWIEKSDLIDFNYMIPTFGITDDDIKMASMMYQQFSDDIKFVCIDVANGHMKLVIEKYKELQSQFPKAKFIVGNISSIDSLVDYTTAGIWCAKVGTGSGSVCTTRFVTGIGVPQASLIQEMVEHRHKLNLNIKIMSDGGIRHTGDIVKSLVLGADYVMAGSYFAGHIEGGNVDLRKTKVSFMGSSYKQTKGYVASEGMKTEIPYKGKLKSTLKELCGGLRSACSYLGVDLDNLYTMKSNIIHVNRQKESL